MPLLWRYLLTQYGKLLLLTSTGCVVILLTMRLEELARIACLGANGRQLLLYFALQLAYLLPIALPLASLLSAGTLFHRLSQTQEITALRSCGVSLVQLLLPLLAAATLLSILNLGIVSELTTRAHHGQAILREALRGINPLALLEHKQSLDLMGIYCDLPSNRRRLECVEGLLLAFPYRKGKRLSLFLANQLEASPQALCGKQITLITPQPDPKGGFDTLLIENSDSLEMAADAFTTFLRGQKEKIQPDYLPMKVLWAKIADREEKTLYLSELIRRLSLAFSVIPLTLLGILSSIRIGRLPSWKRGAVAGALAALFIVAYFAGKSHEGSFFQATLYYCMPYLASLGASLYFLRRIDRGLE